jgi:hypothetical protein
VVKVKINMSSEEYREAVTEIFRQSDTSRDNLLNFPEFKRMYPQVRPESSYDERTDDNVWREIFNIYDRN